mmetsp:Transcript_36583/g.95789  ORF Transcript_36583/g.95789 Transcript_36583/m.95789 type:complete len:275 (-) Transcript_36583:215-1039(-)|eukprot:CAMPEP_0182926702 /NCGR_PEP_ID=MMETSP0105_2-20130417/12219_1 /TAXON_ID=81532 ORGANISM="Acanthoeca-like sp., Strain 10tr" /NCGR_SAMPLE_ID=MMETSP0105_2 /ASSEMBLY_ACC=CAM_ASM_000205 /LENGTH=274 /DNA_ID=CAMNT_0025064605 /DNA_START=25 /DNA_END=849 /DNA_ORIENTATION=+
MLGTAAVVVAVAVGQLSCQFGGSSDSSSDDHLIPTECASYNVYTQAIGVTIPPAALSGDPCGANARCVTAQYKVTPDGTFSDYVALGCIPRFQTDAEITAVLSDPGASNNQAFVSVTSCTTTNCNRCQAAVLEPAFWWHVYGAAIVGCAVALCLCIGCCVTGCFWLARHRENRRNAMRYGGGQPSMRGSETSPLLNPYAGHGGGAGQHDPHAVPPRYADIPKYEVAPLDPAPTYTPTAVSPVPAYGDPSLEAPQGVGAPPAQLASRAAPPEHFE